MDRFFLKHKWTIVPMVLLSAILFFLAGGLSGNYWFLLWLAPIPVLILSRYQKPILVFFAAWVAMGLGNLNFVAYLLKILPPFVVVLFILLSSFFFALAVLIDQLLRERAQGMGLISAIVCFLFPVAYTVLEFLYGIVAPDGTFGSLAYTQTNFFWLIQLASVTGLYGIIFIVFLFSSVVASLFSPIVWKKRLLSIALPVMLIVIVILFGCIRVSGSLPEGAPLTAACISVNAIKDSTNTYSAKNKNAVLSRYEELIIQQGLNSDIVVLPEKITSLTPEEKQQLDLKYAYMAALLKEIIIAGFTLEENSGKRNLSSVYLPGSPQVLDYQKKYLVQGWEKGFKPGHTVTIFKVKDHKVGTVVCKDMDFPGYIRMYGDTDLLVIPAWDFRDDHWLHSRMAVLRGVENGFTVVRSAKEGDLTVSDPYGRILSENSDFRAAESIVKVKLNIYKEHTFYALTGDWFGWSLLALLVISFVWIGIISYLRSVGRLPKQEISGR